MFSTATTTRLLKGLLVFALSTTLAWAFPSPKQIEDALAAQKYVDAKAMVSEVLKEKPANARAHLLNAFLLIHVDHKAELAASEIKEARALDKKGDVVVSPLFGRTVSEIDHYRASSLVPAYPSQGNAVLNSDRSTPVQSPAEEHGVLMYLFWAALGLGLVIWIARRLMPTPATSPLTASTSAATYPAGLQPAGAPAYGPYPSQTPVPVAGTSAGMGALGTIASVGAGVIAGELITDAIRGHMHPSDDRSSAGVSSAHASPDYIPIDNSSAVVVDQASEQASFRSGAESQDWDDAPGNLASSDGAGDWDS